MTDARRFEACIRSGGVAVFPADTVYGLACDPCDPSAVARLYELKGRPPAKPSAVMLFSLEAGLRALPELGERTRAALGRLLPGAVTLLLPNPAQRFPLACTEDRSSLGLRVPEVPALRGVTLPVLQSSANLAGGPDARRLDGVPESIRSGADLVLDGGELPGTPSTIVDLRSLETTGEWAVLRQGAVSRPAVAAALEWQFHFDPATYAELIQSDVPDYDEFQDAVVDASGSGAPRVLELGTGTGETARRLLERHPDAFLVGIDESAPMLAAAREALGSERVSLSVGAIESELPAGPFDLVASALCVHHLQSAAKRDLFERVQAVLAPGGRFVLGDVVVPTDPRDAVIPLSDGFDHPSSLADHLRWLAEAGFDARVAWQRRDLVVVTADAAVAPADVAVTM
ncbi:MAG: Sua5/YciO/YrdC/YwlC family protein [Solirubrobacteraceae bacterium]